MILLTTPLPPPPQDEGGAARGWGRLMKSRRTEGLTEDTVRLLWKRNDGACGRWDAYLTTR